MPRTMQAINLLIRFLTVLFTAGTVFAGEDGGLWQINAPQYNGKTYVIIFGELREARSTNQIKPAELPNHLVTQPEKSRLAIPYPGDRIMVNLFSFPHLFMLVTKQALQVCLIHSAAVQRADCSDRVEH